MKTKVTMDFETRSEFDLKKGGAYEYSMHPTTQVLCMAFKLNTQGQCYIFKFDTMQKHWKNLPSRFRCKWELWIKMYTINAHNAGFEQCIYNNILVRRLGWPAIHPEQWRCSLAKCAALAIPKGLADAGAVLETRIRKDYEGHRIMLKLCKPTPSYKKWREAVKAVESGRRVMPKTRELAACEPPPKFYEPDVEPEDFAKLYHYCKLDVLTEEQVDEKTPDLSPFEQQIWFIDQRTNFRGIEVDTPLVKKISGIMASESKVMTEELDYLTMGLVSSGNQRDAIMDFLTLEGIELPDLKAKTVDDFLANTFMTDDAEKILQIRRALSKSSTAKYNLFQLRTTTDGRVRDILQYHSASTGRWGGKGVQPQNFPRGVIKNIYEAIDRIKTCDLEELKLLYGENLMPLFSSVLRGMFVASPGHDLFVEDYNAIELRVLWWLAGHEDGLDKFRQNIDPYKIRASAIFRKPITEITDDERQVGKAAELGCGFGMGNKKFVSSAWDVYRAKVTPEIAKRAVQSYREDNFLVQEMWDNYRNACIAAIKNHRSRYRVRNVKFYMENKYLKIELPSGRKLSYFHPTVCVDKTRVFSKGDDTIYVHKMTEPILKKIATEKYVEQRGFESEQVTFMAVNHKAKKEECIIPKWTRERTYGGKIVENVVQAVSRDLLAHAIFRAERCGFKVLMHSHDELVVEAPKGRFAIREDAKGVRYCQYFRQLMEANPKWAQGLPLKAGGWADVRYRKG